MKTTQTLSVSQQIRILHKKLKEAVVFSENYEHIKKELAVLEKATK